MGSFWVVSQLIAEEHSIAYKQNLPRLQQVMKILCIHKIAEKINIHIMSMKNEETSLDTIFHSLLCNDLICKHFDVWFSINIGVRRVC